MVIQPLVSEFVAIGKLHDLLIDSKGRIRCLYLSASDREYAIAVDKKQQSQLKSSLQPGCSLKVTGMQKNKLHREEVEYKAYRIELVEELANVSKKRVVKRDRQKKASILVCRGKSCSQRGGRAIDNQLQKELHQAGIANKIQVKATGCMKQCKQAPHIIMPNRQRYSGIKPEQIASIVKKNL